jgi:hypothetical protein
MTAGKKAGTARVTKRNTRLTLELLERRVTCTPAVF